MSDDESSAVKLAKCDLVAGFEEEVDNECCICLVDMEERKFRGKMDCCDHVVCWFCIQEWSQKTARTCPICQRGFHKCKKTKARRKKGRRHTSAQSSDRTKKKERTLWENVRRRFGRPPSSSVPHQSWSEAEDEVDAGEEEVILSPMHDSRDDGGVAGERASGTNSNVDNGNSSSNEDGEEANAGDRNNGSDSSSEGSGAGRDGRRVVDEEEAGREGGNVDEEAEEPEVVAAADVEEEAEAEEGNGVGRSADVSSSSSSSSSREGEEGDAADMADETTALISIFLLENDDEEEDVVADEKRKEKEIEKELEDEEEPTQESADTETNFVAGYDDDPKGKGKEQEEESGGAGNDDEEWERKGSESDDAYEEEEEEEEDSDYDGPVRLPEDN